jgi:hypothetical protein
MKQLIYLSRATQPFSVEDLLALRRISEKNNRGRDVTGCMLYSDRNFIQLLEGPAEAVDALFEKIGRDPRHTDIVVVHDRPAERRAYPSWWMAVHDVEHEDKLGPEIHGTIAGMTAAIEDNPMAAHDLFMHFAEVIGDSDDAD